MGKRPKFSDVEDVRLQREQLWAYERHLEHLSYRQMRACCILPVDAGGLGYDLSEHALAGLVRGYLDRMKPTLEAERDAHLARELADLDALQRLAAAAMRRAEDAGGYDERAAAQYLRIGAERRKLLGLDAPIAATVEVTHHDGVAEELAAMLAENDRPLKRKAKR